MFRSGEKKNFHGKQKFFKNKSPNDGKAPPFKKFGKKNFNKHDDSVNVKSPNDRKFPPFRKFGKKNFNERDNSVSVKSPNDGKAPHFNKFGRKNFNKHDNADNVRSPNDRKFSPFRKFGKKNFNEHDNSVNVKSPNDGKAPHFNKFGRKNFNKHDNADNVRSPNDRKFPPFGKFGKKKFNERNNSINVGNSEVTDNDGVTMSMPNKKKRKFSEDESMFPDQAMSFETGGGSSSPFTKKKKHKKSKLNETLDLSESSQVLDDTGCKVSTKKKKHKKERFTESDQANDEVLETEHLPKKKKKQKKNKFLSSMDVNESTQISEDVVEPEPFIRTKKQKKNKFNKSLDLGEHFSPLYNKAEQSIVKQKKHKNVTHMQEELTKFMKKSMKRRNRELPFSPQPELTKFTKTEDSSSDNSGIDDDDEAAMFQLYPPPEENEFTKTEDSSADDSSMDEEEEIDDAEPITFKRRNAIKRIKLSESEITKQSMHAAQVEKYQRTLFFGNIPVDMDIKTVERIFKPFGKIESIRFRSSVPTKITIPKKVANIKHEYNENCTSLKGFVVFAKELDAKSALSLNGTVVNNHHIRVDRASAQNDDIHTVFVGNLPFGVDDETLWSVFSDCGKITSVRIIRDRETGVGKGFGFVSFEDTESVQAALSLADTEVSGRRIRIKPCEPKSDQNPKFNKSFSREGGQKSFKSGEHNDDMPSRKPKKFGSNKFHRGKKTESGGHKTLKKVIKKKKHDNMKKKVASLFKK